MNKISPLLMLLISSITIYSQTQNIIFDEITYKEGIKTGNIDKVYQDGKGFIWIGGRSGLQRYDGYEFKDYEINSNVINITEDSSGLLWLSTGDGISILYPETEKQINYRPDSVNNAIRKILEDVSGTFWCATHNKGLLKLEPTVENNTKLKELILNEGIESAFNISLFKYDSTSDINRIYDICEDNQNRIWIGSPMGLYIFDREDNEFIRIDDDITGKTRLNHQQVITIIEENANTIWVRDRNGFTRISNINDVFTNKPVDKSKLEFTNYEYITDGIGSYINTQILSFFMDSQHTFWFGTPYDGLVKMSIDNEQNAIFEELYADVHNPEHTFGCVYRIMQDRTGLLWVGHEYKGIRKFRDIDNLFTPLQDKLSEYHWDRYDFNQIYEDDDGNLWICSWGNGVFKISPEGKVNNYKLTDPAYPDWVGVTTISLLEIDKGIFWIGPVQINTNKGSGKILFETNSNIYHLRKIENYVLIGTGAEGLWVYDLITQNIDKYTANQYDTLGLKSDYILSVKIMKNGEIWVSTGNRGLIRLSIDMTTGKLNFLPLPDAITKNYQNIMEENSILDIYEDAKGVLWFSTDKGLVKLNLESKAIRRWTEKDGLPGNIIRYIEEDNNGNFWIGTEYSLSLLDPVTEHVRTFNESDGLPDVRHARYLHASFKNNEGKIYFSGTGGFYRIDPENLYKNEIIPPVVLTEFRLFNKVVEVDSTRNAILTRNISYTQEINLKYNQNDMSFTFAALDYNNPSQNRYSYMLEGYQDEWIETDANNRTAIFTNLSPGEYVFRVKGSNNDGIWNEDGAFITIIIHPPFWKTTLAYIAYAVLFLLLLRGYIFWRTKRLRKEKIVLEKQVSERTADLKAANIRLEEHEKELETTNMKLKQNQKELQEVNTLLEEHQEELQEVNTLLEEQKEELMQQKEELQVTLENLQKTQEQLVESEKMAAVGGLVAGVAHEINTPVGVGITAISNLRDDLQRMAILYEKGEISRENFREFLESSDNVTKLIQKNLERTASLVQSFKQVSTDQITEQQRVFAFKEYLNDILISLQPKFSGKKIDFKIECDEELKLNSYPGVYAQIFTNLLLNSLQHGFYKKDKGTVTIKADMDKNWLKIRFSDDGAGISPKDFPHIFEPFYTSDQHRGTGLGLNIIYNLIRQKLHGTITCESEPGKGVLFKIDVPVK